MTGSAADATEDGRFSALFLAHAERLVRLAALLGALDPEDVVQEAFCRVFAARRRLRDDDDAVRAYLTRSVVNEVRDRHRKAGVAKRDAHLLAPMAPDGIDPADRDAVVRAVAALPLRQREALVLRFWLDLSLAQVAEAMGTRVGTAKSHVSRGLEVVQTTLERDELKGREAR
ncbi:MAG TPA: RNA polymerase sigma factor [Nocardioidaceae bacterium]|nr:RNA polymerase sigma factor [Nocardioidaceae bacterium]